MLTSIGHAGSVSNRCRASFPVSNCCLLCSLESPIGHSNNLNSSLLIFIAEMIAGILAAALVKGLLPEFQVLFTCQLGPETSIAQGLFLEVFLTAQLVFAMMMMAAEVCLASFILLVVLFADMQLILENESHFSRTCWCGISSLHLYAGRHRIHWRSAQPSASIRTSCHQPLAIPWLSLDLL